MDRLASQLAYRAAFTTETLLHGKWRVHILCALCSGPVRLGQLSRAIPRASKKVLAQSLRDLEAVGVVSRKDLSDVVLHVEYNLTKDTKESVLALLNHLSDWSVAYLSNADVNVQKPRVAPAADRT